MIENSIRAKYKENPVLLDKILQDIQNTLVEKLTWLDHAFGKAYKLVEYQQDGHKFVYPAIYNGEGEYVSLLPNDNLGNFSWFDIYDPQKVTQVAQALPQYTVDGALIFWYRLDSIYGDKSVMYTEEIKDEILRILTAPGFIAAPGRLTVTSVYERLENIYRGYTYQGEDIQNVEKQFLMYPYAGIRIEFTLTTRELCQRYIK